MIVVDEIHCEMCRIVVEIVHDMDILKNYHLDIVSMVYPPDHNYVLLSERIVFFLFSFLLTSFDRVESVELFVVHFDNHDRLIVIVFDRSMYFH